MSLAKEKVKHLVTIQVNNNNVISPCGKVSGTVTIDPNKYASKYRGMYLQLQAHFYSKRNLGNTLILEEKIVIKDKLPDDAASLLMRSHDPPQSFPFSLQLPGNDILPGDFDNSSGCVKYRLVFVMAGVDTSKIEVDECLIKFVGQRNLHRSQKSVKPIQMEHSYKKPYHIRTLVKAELSVDKSGFLLGENIPFELNVENRKRIPMEITVQLVQRETTGTGELENMNTAVVSVKKMNWLKVMNCKLNWCENLKIRDNEKVTYSLTNWYSVKYRLMFSVKIGEDVVIEDEAPVIIGTSREPPNV